MRPVDLAVLNTAIENLIGYTITFTHSSNDRRGTIRLCWVFLVTFSIRRPRKQMMMKAGRLVNEDDWYEMVESHPAHEIKMYVMSALELHYYEVRVEHDHSVWISLAPSLDGRILEPIRHVHRRQLMVWYEIHVAGRIPV